MLGWRHQPYTYFCVMLALPYGSHVCKARTTLCVPSLVSESVAGLCLKPLQSVYVLSADANLP